MSISRRAWPLNKHIHIYIYIYYFTGALSPGLIFYTYAFIIVCIVLFLFDVVQTRAWLSASWSTSTVWLSHDWLRGNNNNNNDNDNATTIINHDTTTTTTTNNNHNDNHTTNNDETTTNNNHNNNHYNNGTGVQWLANTATARTG